MIRRVLVVAALLVLAAPLAWAQSDGWSGGWTDPAPTGSRDGKPLAYLQEARPLTGEVSHPNGVSGVSAVIVVDPSNPPTSGCDPAINSVTAEPSGTSATFHVDASFPCNLIYELRATARANPSTGVGASDPAPYQLPLFVAVAIPPSPVSQVDAVLKIREDDRSVTLTWPGGTEPDLLGYVVSRTTGGDTDALGQVNAGDETTFEDDDPPAGTSTYQVTAVRRGPDNDHKQVAAAPTSVVVETPEEEPTDDGTGGGGDPGEPPLTTIVSGEPSQGRPDPGLLSSVNARNPQAPPEPPTTLDTGFEETLTYPSRGVASGAPTGDAAVVAVFDEDSSGSPFTNKETMRFVAAGLAMLVGALIVTYVTRRAAAEAY